MVPLAGIKTGRWKAKTHLWVSVVNVTNNVVGETADVGAGMTTRHMRHTRWQVCRPDEVPPSRLERDCAHTPRCSIRVRMTARDSK